MGPTQSGQTGQGVHAEALPKTLPTSWQAAAQPQRLWRAVSFGRMPTPRAAPAAGVPGVVGSARLQARLRYIAPGRAQADTPDQHWSEQPRNCGHIHACCHACRAPCAAPRQPARMFRRRPRQALFGRLLTKIARRRRRHAPVMRARGRASRSCGGRRCRRPRPIPVRVPCYPVCPPSYWPRRRHAPRSASASRTAPSAWNSSVISCARIGQRASAAPHAHFAKGISPARVHKTEIEKIKMKKSHARHP